MTFFGLEVLEMEQEEQKELTVKDISFNGTGGTDIDGEWQWSGSYEMQLSRSYKPTKYNFYASISRRRSNRGNTIGWYVTLYLSIFYSNGRDIKVLDKKVRSLKSAKQVIFEKIQELHEDVAGTEDLINEWKKNNAQPVFAVDKETGKPLLIGTAYISASVEMDKSKETLWFNEDVPDYNKYKTFYELNVSWRKPVHFYASKTERTWGGYTGSSEKDEALVNQMIELIKGNEKYASLFEEFDRYNARWAE
ncbi:hypothetical protein CVD28_02355 [Bacillus sp. M6-12]|uniref:hypothetical protein n=1 Tax=Bacillus sp. M6-12 TaxID=2054166 RepID=UPI000C75F549|nr:hypothetical protein [Bacillus sp. M6-12]PLS19274.1 hypothetical protein CVD28_02355 [Bacillus sp. M6-12]